MAALCYPTDRTSTKGDSAAALGNRIAKRIIAAGLQGRLAGATRLRLGGLRAGQRAHGGAGAGYVHDRPQSLAAAGPGGLRSRRTVSRFPTGRRCSWARTGATSTRLRCPTPVPTGVPIDPGPPPRLGDPRTDDRFKAKAVEVVRYSSLLDPRDGVMGTSRRAPWAATRSGATTARLRGQPGHR